MSFQLTFLGYYSIKSPQLKKQTHSIKRRNWSHRERTAQADGPRWTASAAGGCPWDRRTRPNIRRTRPWTSGRVTTLVRPRPHLPADVALPADAVKTASVRTWQSVRTDATMRPRGHWDASVRTPMCGHPCPRRRNLASSRTWASEWTHLPPLPPLPSPAPSPSLPLAVRADAKKIKIKIKNKKINFFW
jgi:hypothetical protein